MSQHVPELRGVCRDVVDDEVDHQHVLPRHGTHVVPRAEPGIHLGMVDRVESSVRPVERGEERQDVHPAEKACQWTVQDLAQASKTAPEPVRISDQLDAIVHIP